VDIDNLPEEAREGLEIKFAENMEEIINEVLEETADQV
jgi:ATP-dependent Lon protease